MPLSFLDLATTGAYRAGESLTSAGRQVLEWLEPFWSPIERVVSLFKPCLASPRDHTQLLVSHLVCKYHLPTAPLGSLAINDGRGYYEPRRRIETFPEMWRAVAAYAVI